MSLAGDSIPRTMKLVTYSALTISLKLLLLFLNFASLQAEFYSTKEVLHLFNKANKFELNIFLKINSSDNEIEHEEMLRASETPKMIINEMETNITAIREISNNHCLTVAYINNKNIKEMFKKMDKLLWKLHLSHIMIIWNSNKDEDLKGLDTIFQECWQKGFINVILWHRSELYTYNPFPQIRVYKLPYFSLYGERSYLKNYQHYGWLMPFTEFAPRIFSYTDRWGNLVRSGIFFKIVELFLRHHNGTLNIYEVNMWSDNMTQSNALEILMRNGFNFVGTFLHSDDSYAASDSLWIFYRNLIVPTAQEIDKSLYITKSFSMGVWLFICLIAVLIFCLIYYNDKRHNKDWHRSSLLQTLAIVNGIPFTVIYSGNKFFNFLLVSLYLSNTLLLVSFFNSNLSSLLTTKQYVSELTALEDIGKTNLRIYEYSVDAQFYKFLDLPQIIYRRLDWGNNTYFSKNRKKLNVQSNIFCAFDDVTHYYLLQQTFLKKPIAKKLDEALFGHIFHIPVSHRLPILGHFNQYLLYIKESGIVNKIIWDSYWDGIIAGDIQYFRDEEESHSITLEHFQYAFVILFIGLSLALVCFVAEILRK
ncbi:uncharacterized protein LOC111682087 [Lucilia cuprina]|uniref:uncharacterized protein LOC111682087 n=1 Tax=Lucilia cuprina TaxID=7375 RepID=UPI001F057250|nr:uncharacterized protein LOC111682087 [Lucilia cuprina]